MQHFEAGGRIYTNIRMYKMGYGKIIYSFIFLVLIDQFVKYIIRARGGFYICNANLAFGIKLSYFIIFLLVIAAIFALKSVENHKSKILNSKQIRNTNEQRSKRFRLLNFCNWNLFRISSLEFRVSVILTASGAISNIIDRLYIGCVIDFINLKFWPVFNFADVYITAGAIMILAKTLKSKY
jgi:lipoprotein signal peptidase